jgi:glucose-1-phosphate cytidylyltransferase
MKAVILAGGLGTRMREETEFRPKPMVEVGGKPVLWHIMKILGHQGLTDFIICAGYKGEMIRRYFFEYGAMNQDFTVTLGRDGDVEFLGDNLELGWKVTIADTGQFTLTGGRIRAIEKYLDGEDFLITYGDGIANVDLRALIAKHAELGATLTITTTQPQSRYGVVEIDQYGLVSRFLEKPPGNEIVNIGYMIAKHDLFKFLRDDGPLEEKPLKELAAAGSLGAYRHSGFWQPMDTVREADILNSIWASGNVPWKNW